MAELEGRMGTLRMASWNETEVERLRQENQDLKRQLASGAFSAASQIPFEDLEIAEQIGGGGFSLVYKGFWKGTPVAVKKWFDPNMTDALIQEFREEVMTLQALHHPNVLQFLGACMRPPNLAMVTEMLPTSLHNVLYASNTALDKKRIVELAQDIARAFTYLHSRRPVVVHRDIKPANFLIDRAWKVKVADFGLASQSRTQAGAGTPAYMAPELLDGQAYNVAVDVYAFGVLLNEMVGREVPFSGMGAMEIKQAVMAGGRPDVPLSCPRALQDIIQACWDSQPSARPSFERIQDLLAAVAKA